MAWTPFISPENKKLYWAFALVAGSWLICLMIAGVLLVTKKNSNTEVPKTIKETLQQFTSETEFRTYLENQQQNVVGRLTQDALKIPAAGGPSTFGSPAELNGSETAAIVPERASETNVQVKGIDEPDIVKTDGKHIYIAGQSYGYYKTTVGAATTPSSSTTRMIAPMPPLPQTIKGQVIQSLPVETLKTVGSFDVGGNLLLINNTLIVIDNNTVTGLDVTDPSNPKQIWIQTLSSNQSIQAARLVDSELILVTESRAYSSIPCPIPLFGESGKDMAIRCTDIWHPSSSISADSTYTALKINPSSGVVSDQTTFVGASNQTVIYVSPKALYVSFTKPADWSTLTVDFLLEDTKLITQAVRDRLTKVMALDISDAAKQVEVDSILMKYTLTMNDDDRLRWETERNNLMTEYIDIHKRELERTYIAKIALSDLKTSAFGEVPGHPLNQFSLDEYNDSLRIATTIGGRNIGGGAKSANDVYVLDSTMKMVSSVIDLGKEERIYAVRFMGDKAYVVTFKETDPLYVIDLSNPQSPKVAGELKIPGYSSYLHPLTSTLLVGIGKEASQVKVSLFDVSNPESPTEVAHYQLTDYWSQIMSTHHAFLQDAKHKVFFIPGEKGGYIFDYSNNELKLVKTIEGNGIKRALYIDDNLYLVAENKLTVISEKNWETVNTLEW